MNWLAHVFLSPNNINFQIGNLLADVLKPEQLKHEDEMQLAGVQCHYKIDRFTDTHELVKECKTLFFPKYRHYSAVLVDVFFDHFLAINWNNYSSVSYEEYLKDFYTKLSERTVSLSTEANDFLESVVYYERLSFYYDLSGVERALERISKRRKLNSKIDLIDSLNELQSHYERVNELFLDFFPELIKDVKVNYSYE